LAIALSFILGRQAISMQDSILFLIGQGLGNRKGKRGRMARLKKGGLRGCASRLD